MHITQYNVVSEKFNFRETKIDEIVHQLIKLNTGKAAPMDSTPVKILKSNSFNFAPLLHRVLNEKIIQNSFPDKLKECDIMVLHKKDDASLKANYRPIACLPSISNIFERILENQIKQFASSFLSPNLCGFRKNYSTQHALLRFVECTKRALDRGETAGAVLVDLSKAFGCINHNLLIANLGAYGFRKEALTLIHDYLHGRRQRVKVNGSFSSRRTTFQGVPQDKPSIYN